MPSYIESLATRTSGSRKRQLVEVLSGPVGICNTAGVSVKQYVHGGSFFTLDFTLTAAAVTLALNGTSTAGGGTSIFTFFPGLVSPAGGSSNLTVANAGGDGSFLASVGSAAADTGGTVTGTEISFLPSTAATVSSNVGTCKMKATSTTPTPGARLDGSSTPVQIYLNSCLNADGTGKTAMTFTGTIRIVGIFDGDN